MKRKNFNIKAKKKIKTIMASTSLLKVLSKQILKSATNSQPTLAVLNRSFHVKQKTRNFNSKLNQNKYI